MTSTDSPGGRRQVTPIASQGVLASLGSAPVWVPGEAWSHVPGENRARAQLEGALPQPPLELVVNMHMTAADRHSIGYQLEPSPWLAGEQGHVDPAAVCYFADAPLAHAAQLSAVPFQRLASVTLSVDLIHPVALSALPLTAVATSESDSPRAAVGSVRISSGAGLNAVGSTRTLASEYPDEAQTDPLPFGHDPVPPRLDPPHDTDDPSTALTGLDVMVQMARGDRSSPPFWTLLGISIGHATAGHVVAEARADPWLSGFGVMYGGAVCAVAVAALHACLRSLDSAHERTRILSVAYHFVRPVKPDGSGLSATATVAHRGRTLSIADVELSDADSRTVGLGRATGITTRQ